MTSSSRIEKELDFEDTDQSWQGLPPRNKGGFSVRCSTYVNIIAGRQKKGKYFSKKHKMRHLFCDTRGSCSDK